MRNNNPGSINRRRFISNLAAVSAALGAEVVFHKYLPDGLAPVALAEGKDGFFVEDKSGLTILNDRPVNAETLPHFLNDDGETH